LHVFLDQLFQILIYGGIILGIFVVLLINNKSVRKSRANVFLSVLLMAFSFSMLHIRYAGSVLNHFSAKAYHLGDPTFLLIGPLLWFYIEELTGSHVRFSLKAILHFLPALVIICCSLSFTLIPGENSFILFLNSHPRLPITLFWMIIVIQFSCYQFFIHKKWLAYQQLMQQEVSNTEDISISWVKFFMAVFLVINLFFLFGLFAVIHLDYVTWLWKAVGIVFSLSVFALGYKGILQREIFYPDEIKKSKETSGPLPSAAISKPDRQLVDRIVAYMKEKKAYLDPELTLSKLAKDLSISRSQLSQLINDSIGENFYDFVNKYRVEEVKRLMADPQMKNFNMLGLALEAGFKSKSTFNLIFKRFTGLTPTEYKKNIS
jgi:AraC-like DNA-binding protein